MQQWEPTSSKHQYQSGQWYKVRGRFIVIICSIQMLRSHHLSNLKSNVIYLVLTVELHNSHFQGMLYASSLL